MRDWQWPRLTGTAAVAIVGVGEWTGIARGLLGAPALAALLDAVLIGLLVFAALRSPLRRPVVLDVLVGGFLFLALFEMANPNVPGPTVAIEGFRKTAFMIAGYAISRFAGLRVLDVAIGLVIASLPALLFGIRQFLLPLSIDNLIVSSSGVAATTFSQAGQLRAFSPTAGPFHLGMIAGTTTILGWTLAVGGQLRWLIPTFISAAALLATITRANWVGTAAGALLATAMLAVCGRLSRPRARVALAALVGGIGLLVIAILVGGPTTVDRWLFYLRSVVDPLEARNMQFRFQYWQEFVNAVAAQPLIGYGTSAAADGFGVAYEAGGRSYFQPHSIYFKAVLEMGVLGLLLLTAILTSTVATAWSIGRYDPRAAGMIAGLVVFVAIAGVTGPMLDAYPFNLMFWLLIGCAVNQAPRPRGSADG